LGVWGVVRSWDLELTAKMTKSAEEVKKRNKSARGRLKELEVVVEEIKDDLVVMGRKMENSKQIKEILDTVSPPGWTWDYLAITEERKPQATAIAQNILDQYFVYIEVSSCCWCRKLALFCVV
jgi:hypothetical protein